MENVLQPLENEKDISKQWLELMLTEKFGVKTTVVSWDIRLPKGRDGFLSEIAFVSVKYLTSDHTETDVQLVFKFLPKDPNLKKFIAAGGLALREVEFYRFTSSKEFQRICQKIGIVMPVPEPYYAGYSENAITIVLRDLNTDRYKSVIVKEGSTLSQTKTALQAMAVIHAAGVLYIKEFGKMNSLQNLAREFNSDFYDQFLLPNLDTLTNMYEGTRTADTMKALKSFSLAMRTELSRHPLFETIIHGDLWAGQVLYTEDERFASIFDWQFCRIDNPVCDILSEFFMSSNPSVMENHLEEVLQAYWETLTSTISAGGGSIEVTYDQLVANVEELWVYGFLFLAVSLHDFLGGDNITEGRIFGATGFVEKKGAFEKFLKECRDKSMTKA